MVEVELDDVGENRGVGLERDRRPSIVAGTDGFELGHANARLKSLLVNRAIPVNHNIHPFRNCVDRRNTDTVQTPAYLVGAVVELSTSVQLRHDDLGSRDAEFLVLVDGDAPPVVSDRQ